LHYLCETQSRVDIDDMSVLKRLAPSPEAVNTVDKDGNTPLHLLLQTYSPEEDDFVVRS
jgi:hypothetical protein